MLTESQSIAIIGATGQLGRALAWRLAKAGENIILGSREPSRAQALAATLVARTGHKVSSAANAEAAAAADIVIIAVPFAAQRATLGDIVDHVAGKLVIDTTVPLVPPKVARVQLPADGSAALAAQRLLGAGTYVVSAFHNVAAHKLATDEFIDCDVLVFGEHKQHRMTVIRLIEACGLRGVHGGPLENSIAAEALTSVLISINRTYGIAGAGIRITGQLPGEGR